MSVPISASYFWPPDMTACFSRSLKSVPTPMKLCMCHCYFADLFIISASLSVTEHLPGPSVRLSVRKVYYGKTADWIRMLFGVESGVSRGRVY